MYDVMAAPSLRGRRSARRAAAADGESDWSPARHRLIAGDEVVALLPALAHRRPTGGYLFYDCQTDDARLVLTVLGEAERFGAICANRLRVTELHAEPGADTARDGAGPRRRTRRSPSAPRTWSTPPACGRTGSAPTSCTPRPSCRRSPPAGAPTSSCADEDLPLAAGAIVPAGQGRSIFALPWLGRSLIGTTDNNYDGDVEHVAALGAGHRLPAGRGQRVLRASLGAEHATGAYAGVRPLISSGDSRKSVDISRKAELYETSSGLITITGGKLTTWRRMAQLAVDRLVERDGRQAPCRTHEIPLGAPVDPAALARVDGVAEPAYAMLAGRYGHAAERVLQLAAAAAALAEPIVADLPDLLAEAPFAARHEQARTVGDVLLRRTRLGLLAARELCAPDAAAPRRVAEAMGAALGWDAARVDDEVARFAQEARAEGIAVAYESQPA